MKNAWTKEIDRLKAENKELLEACKALLQEAEYREKNGEAWGFSIDSARAAIEMAEEGTP